MGFDSGDQPGNFTSNWIQIIDFLVHVTFKFDDLEKQMGTSSVLCHALCIISNPLVNSNWSYSPETLNLCQNGDFLFCVTLKFHRWPWKIIRHHFYATSSFVDNFKAIGEFKLECLSGKAQIGSKSAIFFPCDLVICGWPQKTIGHLFYATSRFEHNFIAICEFKLELQFGKSQFGSKSSPVTLKFDRWTWKTLGHLFCATSNFMHHFVAICEFEMKIQSGNTQYGSKSAIFFIHMTLKFDRWPWKSKGHLS